MKRLIAYINAEGLEADDLINSAKEFENHGIDGLMITNYSEAEAEHEAFLDAMRALKRRVDIPVMISCPVKRFEDSKKAFYTGARYVVLRYSDIKGKTLLKESVDRFGADHICISFEAASQGADLARDIAEGLIAPETSLVYIYDKAEEVADAPLAGAAGESLVLVKASDTEAVKQVLAKAWVEVLATGAFTAAADRIMELKNDLRSQGIKLNTFAPGIGFGDLKTNSEGMVPCIVQDYKTNEVLMLAYMDEEAFNRTAATGIMTYYSRSRRELWIKGLTSGHFQYLKELKVDCDKDTLLAKVDQVGAACHTGNRSCFYTQLLRHDYDEKNAYAVLKELYDVVMDRKKHPKEGSYTNYLFDKGIDKILKKCGEEATEMVIAAKNPNAEELKYEIADLLYHMTVLMAECGVDWDDVMEELANR